MACCGLIEWRTNHDKDLSGINTPGLSAVPLTYHAPIVVRPLLTAVGLILCLDLRGLFSRYRRSGRTKTLMVRAVKICRHHIADGEPTLCVSLHALIIRIHRPYDYVRRDFSFCMLSPTRCNECLPATDIKSVPN